MLETHNFFHWNADNHLILSERLMKRNTQHAVITLLLYPLKRTRVSRSHIHCNMQIITSIIIIQSTPQQFICAKNTYIQYPCQIRNSYQFGARQACFCLYFERFDYKNQHLATTHLSFITRPFYMYTYDSRKQSMHKISSTYSTHFSRFNQSTSKLKVCNWEVICVRS